MTGRFELSHTSRGPWRLATLAATALPTLACGPGSVTEDEGFRITAVDFDGDSTVTITFSQPLAPVGEVDPNDFRISFASTASAVYTYNGMTTPYESTFYQDLGLLDYGYYYNYEDLRFTFASASLGGGNQLILEATTPLMTDVCAEVEDLRDYSEMYFMGMPEAKFTVGLFLHYAAGDIPISSDEGEELRDYAADWALEPMLSIFNETYGFPDMMPRLELPCP